MGHAYNDILEAISLIKSFYFDQSFNKNSTGES